MPKPRTTSEKLVAEQGHEQAGERHCIAKDGAEQGAIELPAGEAPDKQEDAAARRRLDRVELADRDTAEQQHDDDRRDRRLGRGASAQRRQRRAGAAAPAPGGDGEGGDEHPEARQDRCLQDVLGIDDAHVRMRRVHRLGMRAHHRVAEQQQHQRRWDDDAERAGDADRCRRFRGRDVARREGRCDAARQHVQARADRAVHRRQQGADAERGKLRRGRAAREEPLAARMHQAGQRQAVQQRADEGVQRQRLQQVMLEQADDPRWHGAEKADVERTARHADGGEERGDTEEHAIHGQAGRDHEPHGHDEHGHAEPAHGAAATSSSPASGKGCGPMARVRSACSSMSRASSQGLTRIRK